jgi:hypothetical protein
VEAGASSLVFRRRAVTCDATVDAGISSAVNHILIKCPQPGVNTSYPRKETWLPEHFAREQIPRHPRLHGRALHRERHGERRVPQGWFA